MLSRAWGSRFDGPGSSLTGVPTDGGLLCSHGAAGLVAAQETTGLSGAAGLITGTGAEAVGLIWVAVTAGLITGTGDVTAGLIRVAVIAGLITGTGDETAGLIRVAVTAGLTGTWAETAGLIWAATRVETAGLIWAATGCETAGLTGGGAPRAAGMGLVVPLSLLFGDLSGVQLQVGRGSPFLTLGFSDLGDRSLLATLLGSGLLRVNEGTLGGRSGLDQELSSTGGWNLCGLLWPPSDTLQGLAGACCCALLGDVLHGCCLW